MSTSSRGIDDGQPAECACAGSSGRDRALPPALVERLALEFIFLVPLLIMVVLRRYAISELRLRLVLSAQLSNVRFNRAHLHGAQRQQLDIDEFRLLIDCARRLRLDRSRHVQQWRAFRR